MVLVLILVVVIDEKLPVPILILYYSFDIVKNHYLSKYLVIFHSSTLF